MALYGAAVLSGRFLRGKVLPLSNLGRLFQTASRRTNQTFFAQQKYVMFIVANTFVFRIFSEAQPNYLKFVRFSSCKSSNFMQFCFLALPPHVVVKLPNLSPTMETGNVVSWAKNEGDQVGEGDVLAEIETDKATMSMDSGEEGYIAKILIPAGTKNVPIGSVGNAKPFFLILNPI